MKRRWDKRYLYIGLTAMVVICACIAFYFYMERGANFREGVSNVIAILMPVIDGLVIAYLITPILNFIENFSLKHVIKKERGALTRAQTKWLRCIAIVLDLLFLFCLIYAFIAVVIPQLIDSIRSIIANFSTYINRLSLWLDRILEDYPELDMNADQLISTYAPQIQEWLEEAFFPEMGSYFRVVSNYAFSVFGTVWNLFIGLIISIYLMAGKERFIGQCKKIIYAVLDVKYANGFMEDLRFAHRTFGGFISGKLTDSLIIGILCFIGTSIIGTPYPILVSVIIGVTNIIPFFGPYIGAIPSTILVFMIDPIQAVYFLIFIIVLQQFDGNILGPKILGDSTGLTSFWVIFSITLFGGLFGLVGMVIGVPTFAIVYAMVRRWINLKLKKKKFPTDTSTYADLYRINEKNGNFVNYEDLVDGQELKYNFNGKKSLRKKKKERAEKNAKNREEKNWGKKMTPAPDPDAGDTGAKEVGTEETSTTESGVSKSTTRESVTRESATREPPTGKSVTRESASGKSVTSEEGKKGKKKGYINISVPKHIATLTGKSDASEKSSDSAATVDAMAPDDSPRESEGDI